MRKANRCALVMLAAGFLSLGASAQAAGPEKGEERASAPGEETEVINPLSPEAYRAEFRYLRDVLREIDLAGPAVETDGWTYNIPEAEWPFMATCFFAYACANLAKCDPLIRDEALEHMRWSIEALQTPRLTGFITNHFGPPFAKKNLRASPFVHGHFLNVVVRYREVSGDERFDGLAHRVASALSKAYEKDDQGVLASYSDMWWLSENFVALSALARYDRVFDRNTARVTSKFLSSVRAHYTDKATGLFATCVFPKTRVSLQGPRGISVMYGLHFLKDFSEDYAAEQYALARRILIRSALGLAAVREFPEGAEGTGDVDSGPILFGLGPSASGFAIGAAAVMDDRQTAMRLLRASVLAGIPQYSEGKLRYETMPTVGQAVILFGKTVLMNPRP